MAGVEPSVVNLNGDDPTAYVLSANIHRRHMTKGQRAMAVATIVHARASDRLHHVGSDILGAGDGSVDGRLALSCGC